ncbi:hypothetical protein XM53_08000 [Roseovarius atlanticus]|uniref:Uncharacterized protein n=1 Tax=Roseovarius atlanticus TaxID=1641875 RepID=A0A0T5NWE8_9RHOB|nr:hypothetical protein XM53_08000 [Roseovarius atlanticus]
MPSGPRSCPAPAAPGLGVDPARVKTQPARTAAQASDTQCHRLFSHLLRLLSQNASRVTTA